MSIEPKRRKREKKGDRAERKLARDLADRQLLLDIVGLFKSFGQEFVRAAQSNPLIGIFLTIVLADVLFRLGILSVIGFTFILTTVGVLEASKVTSDVLSDITKIFDFAGSSPPPTSALEPSATTIVNTTEIRGDNAAVAGILESLKRRTP